MPGRPITTYALVLQLLVVLATIGCDPAFEPLQENNRYHFSIYGYLDASADTQWVRVMPVRDSVLYKPDPIDATVTLEEVGSDRSAVMNDSLFSYPEGTFAHTFWTTMDLEPERSYRITAENREGATSHVEVTLPGDFPTPEVNMGEGFNEPDVVTIAGSIRLADVQTVYHGRESSGEVRLLGVPHRQDTARTMRDKYVINIEPGDDRSALAVFPPVFKRQIFVAAAGPDWHPFASLNPNVRALPEGISNVENGVGFLTGVVSKPIPYKSCFADDGITIIPCPTQPTPW